MTKNQVCNTIGMLWRSPGIIAEHQKRIRMHIYSPSELEVLNNAMLGVRGADALTLEGHLRALQEQRETRNRLTKGEVAEVKSKLASTGITVSVGIIREVFSSIFPQQVI